MIVIGVTGIYGSGKSEVAKTLKSLGVPVFDADEAARRALRKGSASHRAVLQIFGSEFADDSGRIDRKKLAARVFSHPRELKKLNVLVHPGVIIEAMKFIQRHRKRSRFVVLDVPLLYESHMEKLANVIIVVSATRPFLMDRIRSKGVPAALAQKIWASQWPLKTKERRADFVIKNDSTLAALRKKTRLIFKKIKETY